MGHSCGWNWNSRSFFELSKKDVVAMRVYSSASLGLMPRLLVNHEENSCCRSFGEDNRRLSLLFRWSFNSSSPTWLLLPGVSCFPWMAALPIPCVPCSVTMGDFVLDVLFMVRDLIIFDE